MVFKLKKTHCQQLPRTKHLYTSAPARIASKSEYFQLMLRAKHLLTSALARIATKTDIFNRCFAQDFPSPPGRRTEGGFLLVPQTKVAQRTEWGSYLFSSNKGSAAD